MRFLDSWRTLSTRGQRVSSVRAMLLGVAQDIPTCTFLASDQPWILSITGRTLAVVSIVGHQSPFAASAVTPAVTMFEDIR